MQTDNQAMTEVALSLAMAFFALMILAMVSMSVKPTVESKSAIVTAELTTATDEKESQSASTPLKNDDVFIIFYQGTYFDTSLMPLSIDALPQAKRTILALSPQLPLDEVLKVKSKISAPNLLITELNEAWLERLAE